MNEPQMSFMHLVHACTTDKERAELAMLLAHAVLGMRSTVEGDTTGVPRRLMLAAREACHALSLLILPAGTEQ